MNVNTLSRVAIGLVLAILAVVGYKLSPMRGQMADVTLPVSTCNPAQQACVATLSNGRQIEFAIEPRPVRPLETMRVTVATPDPDIQSIDVDFKGTDMDMGYNRVKLARGQQGFSGQAMLPVCVTGTMTWTVTVLLTSATQRIAVPFHLVVAGR